MAVAQQHVYQRNLVCNGDEVRRPDRNEVTRVLRATHIQDEALRLKVEGLGVEEALAHGFRDIGSSPPPDDGFRCCDRRSRTTTAARPIDGGQTLETTHT